MLKRNKKFTIITTYIFRIVKVLMDLGGKILRKGVKTTLKVVVGLFIFLLFGFLFWIYFSKDDVNSGNDYFTGSATIFASLIAVIGVYITVKSSEENKKKELLDNLDSKSEWRKQLYDVASKTFINTDDVFRVLASLRYFPHEKYNNKESKNKKCNDEQFFREATQTIYSKLYLIVETHKDEIDKNIKNRKCQNIKAPILSFEESEKVRVYTKYLLKHHWEYNYDKKSFAPEKEEKVWRKTKELTAKIDGSSESYFHEVTKFNSKNVNPIYLFLKLVINKVCSK